MSDIMYTGVFVDHNAFLHAMFEDNPSLRRLGHLPRILSSNYILVKRNPSDEEVYKELFGSRVVMRFIGYGRNDNVEGLLCEIYPSDNEKLNEVLSGIREPIIVVSTSPHGRVSDAQGLKFWPLFNPFFIDGVYDGVGPKEKENGKVSDSHASK